MKVKIVWTAKIDKKICHGTFPTEREAGEVSELSLFSWAEKKLEETVSAYSQEGYVPDSYLARAVVYLLDKGITPIFKVTSAYQYLTDDDNVGSENKKTKEKIKKLLSLSLSDNENEATLASQMAIKLMKKNSLSASEVEEQDILMFELSPIGKRIAVWEISLATGIGRASGCNVVYNRSGDPKIKIMGRERDVLNARYVFGCYLREVVSATKKFKKEFSVSVKEGNDYRTGLVIAIVKKLEKNTEEFFTKETSLYEIISLDKRIEDAEELLGGAKTKKSNTNILVSKGFLRGEKDGKAIHIDKATPAGTETKLIV